jgi:hypothetical protein
MKILVLSENGFAVPMGDLAAAQGDDVKVWCGKPTQDGPALRVPSWRPFLDEAEAIVVDEGSHKFAILDEFWGKKLLFGRCPQLGKWPHCAWSSMVPTAPQVDEIYRAVVVVGKNTLFCVRAPRRIRSALIEPLGNSLRCLPYIGPVAFAYKYRWLFWQPILTNFPRDRGYPQLVASLREEGTSVAKFLEDVHA